MSYNRLKTEKPTIVIAHRLAEYERYAMSNGLDETNSIFVTNPTSLDNYPMDCPIVKTGEYWLSNVEGSRQLKERETYLANNPAKTKTREENLYNACLIYEAALTSMATPAAFKALEDAKSYRKEE